MKTRLLPMVVLLLSVSAQANQLADVKLPSGNQANINDKLTVELMFIQDKSFVKPGPLAVLSAGADELEPVRCGVSIDWGDGNSKTARLGKDINPPFLLAHKYKAEGNYAIRVTGKALIRGLNSISACRGTRSVAVTVVDPQRLERERRAEQQRIAEQERAARQAAAERKRLDAARRAKAQEEKRLAEAREVERAREESRRQQEENARRAYLAEEQERRRQAEDARKAELAAALEQERLAEERRLADIAREQQRREQEFAQAIERLAGAGEPVVWVDGLETKRSIRADYPLSLDDVNPWLWDQSARIFDAGRKPKPVKPVYSAPVLRPKGEFEKTSAYQAYASGVQAKQTAAFQARMEQYKSDLARFDDEQRQSAARTQVIHDKLSTKHIPEMLGSIKRSFQYNADREHYEVVLTSSRYGTFRISGIVPVPISEARAMNDQIRVAPLHVVLSKTGQKLKPGGVILGLPEKNYVTSAVAGEELDLSQAAATTRRQQLEGIARREEERRQAEEEAKRREAKRLAAIEAQKRAERERQARLEAQRLAARIEENRAISAQKKGGESNADHSSGLLGSLTALLQPVVSSLSDGDVKAGSIAAPRVPAASASDDGGLLDPTSYVDILLNPAAFLGNEVRMAGEFNYKNTSRRSFDLRQGDEEIEVFFNMLDKGMQARILALRNFSSTPVSVRGVVSADSDDANKYYLKASEVVID